MKGIDRRQFVQSTLLAGATIGLAERSLAAQGATTPSPSSASSLSKSSKQTVGGKKIALVTGATRGLGLETTRQLAAKGVLVVLGARQLQTGEARAAELRAAGLDVEAIELDLDDATTVVRAAKALEDKYGRLDILVNNAGIFVEDGDGLPGTVSLDAIQRTFQTNFIGTLMVTQHMLPLIRKSSRGRIVNVSSTIGSLTVAADPTSKISNHQTLAYAASKTALNMMTVQLAYELRDTSIKVNSVCPGFVKTDFNKGAGDLTVEQGARPSVRFALLGDDGPSGGFFTADGPRPW